MVRRHFRWGLKLSVVLAFSTFLGQKAVLTAQNTGHWVQVDEGLFVGTFVAPQKSPVGDSKITVIKIDPQKYSFKLLCAGQLHHASLTAEEWCKKYGLIGAINAGLFQDDYESNVGYMKNFDYINNGRISKRLNSVVAFNPADADKPRFRIYDVEEKKVREIAKMYHTVIQNLRLIKRPGINVWPKQARKWSEAALGQDREGNVLFIFCRSPYSMHDFNNILLSLPINIVCAQHLEGGPEASLYFSYKGVKIRAFGSYETGFNENDKNNRYWPIPNVIGFVKRAQ